jgi:hypothetical protein
VTTLTAEDVTAPVAGYAQRLHATAGERHHVASPLGAWLLLALCATASEGERREILNATLGCDCADAADLAVALLASPNPVVPAAAGAWLSGGRTDSPAQRWYAGLPSAIQSGPVPGQAEANDWARRHTFGLIERMPVRVDASVWLLVATVLATRVSWAKPFDLAPAAALGPLSPWAGALSQVLRTPESEIHSGYIATTAAAGDVAVHTAWASDNALAVTSVAAEPGVPPGQVLAAAYELAPARLLQRQVPTRSLFDLPLGDGPLWSITERRGTVMSGSGREEHFTAVLPAWSARSDHNLGQPSLGFDAAVAALAAGNPWEAKQAAMARYTRVGFEAAAVSAAAVALSMRVPRDGVVRTAELRFGHPYAVVAVATDWSGHGPWHGLPVFSAWVAQPQNAEP